MPINQLNGFTSKITIQMYISFISYTVIIVKLKAFFFIHIKGKLTFV